MLCSLEELKTKEVIDVKTGERLGYIDDVRINTDTSEVTALLIYGSYRFFGLFGRESDREIPCGAIRVIGSDIILINGSDSSNSTSHRRNPIKSLFG